MRLAMLIRVLCEPLSSLCLCGGSLGEIAHHRDTENTEVTQRISDQVIADQMSALPAHGTIRQLFVGSVGIVLWRSTQSIINSRISTEER